MGLDFKSAAALFIASEEELARALSVEVADIRSYRQNPSRVPDEVMDQLASVLIERGRGMQRVGEMLQE